MSEQSETSFELKVITQPYVEQALEFLQKFFWEDEPMNEYLNRKGCKTVQSGSRAEHRRDVIIKQLSVMAVTSSEEIIGICINNDGKQTHSDDASSLTVTGKIMKMLEKQEAVTTDQRTKIMSLDIMVVHPNWRNRGIGRCLLNYTRQLAKQHGFSCIQSICSSEYTIRMFQRQGFECTAAIKYEDFKVDGVVVLKPALPHTHIKSMLLKL